MRIRLLIPIAAALALSACGERPTPKPPLPTKVTTPIQPAAPEAAATPATATAACPPQPALVCPPAAAKPGKVKAQRIVHRRAHSQKAHRPKTYAKAAPPREPGLYPYKRYHGETMQRDYAERDGGSRREHHHRHGGGYEDGYKEGYEAGYAAREVDHYHAYGNSGAVEHYAQPGERRFDDRYSAGGGYERYERHDSYSSGQAETHGYAERSRGRSSSSYSESYSEGGGYRQETWSSGCCGPATTGAAGRDRNGFLAWPGKVPAAGY